MTNKDIYKFICEKEKSIPIFSQYWWMQAVCPAGDWDVYLVGNGKDILMNIDMVGQNLETGQGMCGASSGSIPTDVGQPLIRVSSITVGGR